MIYELLSRRSLMGCGGRQTEKDGQLVEKVGSQSLAPAAFSA
jgi:hypothetical protein